MNRPTKLAVAIGCAGLALGAALWLTLGAREPAVPSGPPIKITLAVNPSYAGSGLVLVAAQNGYFRDAGLEVELQPHTTGKAALESALSGKADLVTSADAPIMFAALSGRPLLIVATIASEISDHGIIARRDRGIARLEDLGGKRIGVTLGTTGHFFVDAVRTYHRIPAASAGTLKDLRPEAMSDALLRGEVDAVATWSPILGQVERALGANAIRFSGGDVMRYTFNLSGAPEFVRASGETVRRLLRALARAERYLDEHRAEARAIIAKATGSGWDPEDPRWGYYRLRLALEQGLLIQLEDEARWAIRNGYAGKAALPNFLDFIYTDAMAAVKPEALSVIR